MDTKHTPMRQNGPVIFTPDGGFDVRHCSHEEELAEFIVRACNAHEQLVAALTKIANSDNGEDGCYYTNRENIRTAQAALKLAGAA